MANLDLTTYKATIAYMRRPNLVPCRCSDCTWSGRASQLREIVDCSLTPGDASPAGRCPKCDSLAYVAEEDVRIVERDTLEPQDRESWPLPWGVRHAGGMRLHFEQEDHARAYQTAWRRAHFLNPETGEPLAR